MHKAILLFIFISLCYNIEAQIRISGTVVNDNSERLVSASVFLVGTNYAVITNESGTFELSDISPGNYTLKCTYVGYRDYITELNVIENMSLDINLNVALYHLEKIQITANRLEDKSPFSFVELDKKMLQKKYSAQDIPVLLEHTPSVVSSSDAGGGVGYTGMRIRGSDATRINVTINGVPLNDSESHGVFWVDLPDFSNSIEELQIQRGVGPSTNGAGSFGASLNLKTNNIYQNPFIGINSSFGSFNTKKLAFSVNTGLINNSFQIEGRYSIINSDGYIDRSESDLNSWYFSATKIGKRSSLRFNAFSGKERTYQAWWGTPEAKLSSDLTLEDHYYNNLGSTYLNVLDSINLFDSDRRYNYYLYENQVDDYKQDHYHLVHALQIGDRLNINSTLFYTKGKGFFEECRINDELQNYGISDSIMNTDLVRRRWLDNDFYGLIVNSEYHFTDHKRLLVGASYNKYHGDHFGQLIRAEKIDVEDRSRHYYDNSGRKTDFNAYAKADFAISNKMSFFGDIQLRRINYSAGGLDNGFTMVDIDTSYTFINPKLAISYDINEKKHFYFSYSKAQREPVRSDFIDAVGTSVPKKESLHDIEIGYRYKAEKWGFNGNLYYMKYKDQLIVTGALNDVGAAIRQNVPNSYRLGLETSSFMQFNNSITGTLNLSLSRNKINNFDELIFDYGLNEEIVINHENTDIAFSPAINISGIVDYKLREDLTLSWMTKYVSKQFLDNTSDDSRSIDAYFLNDLILDYTLENELINNINLKLIINNIFDIKYASNGYTYSYKYGELITENFYYPQAGINFALGLDLKF